MTETTDTQQDAARSAGEQSGAARPSNSQAAPPLTPWNQRRRTGARAIAEQLRAAGLVGRPGNLLVGNPGSGEELLYLELADEVNLALAEAAVGNLADGASRLHSKPAVAIAHGFVGFSGLQGAVFNAAQRQSPLLVIVGVADSHAHTGETHMFADVAGAATAARTKYVKCASDSRTLLRDLRDAIIASQLPPYGPVVFIVGSNVASMPNTEPVIEPAIPSSRLAPPKAEVQRLAEQLRRATRPAILIGDGVARSGAQAELQKVAELVGAEVWASMESEVNFPRNHPAFQGNLGHMDDSRGRELLQDVDFALAVGTPIYQTVFHSRAPLFRPGTGIATINFDVDSTLRGHNDVTFPILGDPQRVLAALAEVLQQDEPPGASLPAQSRLEQMRQRKEQSRQERHDRGLQEPGVTMAKFARTLEQRMKTLPQRPVIFSEALAGADGLADQIENPQIPGKYFDTSGGSLGEWAGGVGAALTGAWVIAVIGDGGFHYAPQALWNAAHRRLRLGLVVANNSGYGLLYDNMDFSLRQLEIDPGTVPRQHYYEIPQLDYVSIARGYGVPGMRVEREDQIEESVEKLLGGEGPFLIDLVLEPYRQDSSPTGRKREAVE